MADEEKELASQLYNDDTAQEKTEDVDAQTQEKTDEIKATDKEPEKKEGDESEKADAEKEKVDEANKDQVKAPEKYELKLPEKSQLQESDIERIAQYAKERGLSNDQAQEIVKVEHEAISNFIKSETDRLNQLSQKDWVEAAKKDKEIGGDDYSKNVELAKRVVEKFADEKLIDELEVTGFGNHPELVRLFVRVGKHMAEDTLVRPGVTAGGKKSMEEIFYGNKN
jgi:predicted XRE-type DNA-binding protein